MSPKPENASVQPYRPDEDDLEEELTEEEAEAIAGSEQGSPVSPIEIK